MQVAQQVLVLVHLVGFAALFGGVLVQTRALEPEVSTTMLVGGWTLLGSGLALGALELATGGAPPVPQLVVKLAATAFLVLLLARNRRFLSVPRGLWALIGVLTLATAALSVLWT